MDGDMAAGKSEKVSDPIKRLRRRAGAWLKLRRNAVKLTQKDLAKELGLEYYTFVSQIESGHGRVPSNLYESWAACLQMQAPEFAKKMLEFYDPYAYRALGFDFTEPLAEEVLNDQTGS